MNHFSNSHSTLLDEDLKILQTTKIYSENFQMLLNEQYRKTKEL